ncbi:Hypothetical predicted protein [Pelobates cultripes]|uniref:Uncharacterized protein n=1 Tax=Pelobates cultripes TaxID=61616 RepID=A0AAD1TK40_PELCU|nr:Hypothetical predicted protein [Pelobates cultripes]
MLLSAVQPYNQWLYERKGGENGSIHNSESGLILLSGAVCFSASAQNLFIPREAAGAAGG